MVSDLFGILRPDGRRQYRTAWWFSFLARNIAQLGLKVYRRVSDTDRCVVA